MFIEVWSSECNHCIASIPTVKEIHENYGQAIQVVTINMDYDLKKAKQAIQEHQLPFIVLMGDASFYRDYLIRSFPTYFVVDKDVELLFNESVLIKNKVKTKLNKMFDKVSEIKLL